MWREVMAKIRPEGMKTSYKFRTCWGTWDNTDPKGTKHNVMTNEDRKKLGLPIDEQLEDQPKGEQDDK